jgi:hypothetical protein
MQREEFVYQVKVLVQNPANCVFAFIKDCSKSSDCLAEVLFIGGGDSGDGVLSWPVFFMIGMPLIKLNFLHLNFFDNFIYLCPLQVHIAVGLISKIFYYLHTFFSYS